MNDNLSSIPVRVVCVGFAPVVGGGLGELFILEESARHCESGDALREQASVFGLDKKAKPTVGAIYETDGRIEEGRLTSLGRDRRYVGMLDTDPIRAAILASRGVEARERAKKAEAKARATIPNERAIDELAAIVAAGRIDDMETIVFGITTAIRKRSLELWRAKRRAAK